MPIALYPPPVGIFSLALNLLENIQSLLRLEDGSLAYICYLEAAMSRR
jgi:hypothetical protein